MWILMVLWAGTVSGAEFQEFNTKDACEAAKEWVQVQQPGRAEWRVTCRPKGEPTKKAGE